MHFSLCDFVDRVTRHWQLPVKELFSFPFLLVVVWCICWCWGLGSRQFEPSYSWSSAALVVSGCVVYMLVLGVG